MHKPERPLDSPFRLVLQWHLTERCNWRCAHCYQETYSDAELPLCTLREVLGQFRELVAQYNAGKGRGDARGHVTVTGGEPFVRRDFMEFLELLSSGASWAGFSILTNGSFIDAPTARRLRALGVEYVQVSLEGGRAANDRVRGQGAYDCAVAALKCLVAAGVRSAISFTVHRDNLHEFGAVAALGRELGVTQVWSDRLIPCGSGAALRDQMLSPEETREYFEIMQRAHADAAKSFCRTAISMQRALQFLVGGGKPYHCAAGDRLIALLPNGDVLPCRRMPIPVGNVLERPLAEIYCGSDLLRSLRDPKRIPEGCRQCPHAFTCGGGLRCLAYAVHGDPFMADPGCWHVRPPDARVAQPAPSAAGAMPLFCQEGTETHERCGRCAPS